VLSILIKLLEKFLSLPFPFFCFSFFFCVVLSISVKSLEKLFTKLATKH